MCFHWKSLRRQVRVLGKVEEVSEKKQTIILTHVHIKIKLARGLHHNQKY